MGRERVRAGAEEPLGEHLRNVLPQAHAKGEGLAVVLAAHHLSQFGAEGKDLVAVAQHRLPQGRELKAAANALEK
jgi:hypothetical protein